VAGDAEVEAARLLAERATAQGEAHVPIMPGPG
jgi:hypothetical protein